MKTRFFVIHLLTYQWIWLQISHQFQHLPKCFLHQNILRPIFLSIGAYDYSNILAQIWSVSYKPLSIFKPNWTSFRHIGPMRLHVAKCRLKCIISFKFAPTFFDISLQLDLQFNWRGRWIYKDELLALRNWLSGFQLFTQLTCSFKQWMFMFSWFFTSFTCHEIRTYQTSIQTSFDWLNSTHFTSNSNMNH